MTYVMIMTNKLILEIVYNYIDGVVLLCLEIIIILMIKRDNTEKKQNIIVQLN